MYDSTLARFRHFSRNRPTGGGPTKTRADTRLSFDPELAQVTLKAAPLSVDSQSHSQWMTGIKKPGPVGARTVS